LADLHIQPSLNWFKFDENSNQKKI